MDETFHIPISEAQEDSGANAESANEWAELANEFTDDFMRRTQEIAERNTFDFSEAKSEKSEEEKNYEQKEKDFIYELTRTSEKDARYLSNAGDEYKKIFKQFEDPRTQALGKAFDGLSMVLKSSNRKTLEAMVGFIDKKYPSPYKTEPENSPLNPFLLDETGIETNSLENSKDDYRTSVMKQGQQFSEISKDLTKLFTANGNQRELYVGSAIKTLAEGKSDVENAFCDAIIKYAENPTTDNKSRLKRVQSNRDNIVASSLFNIAGAFDKGKTRMDSKIFETTVALTAQLVKNSENYFDLVMDYLKFKIDNSAKPEEVVPAKTDDEKNVPVDAFINALPGNVIS